MPRKKQLKTAKQQTEISNSARVLFRRIRDASNEGESGAATLRRFRESGLKIRTSEFYKTWNLAKDYQSAGRSIKYSKQDYVLPDSKIPIVPQHTVMRGNYQYIIKVKGKTLEGDDAAPTHITIRSSTNISKRRINGLAGTIVSRGAEQNSEKYGYDLDTISFEIVEAYRRG